MGRFSLEKTVGGGKTVIVPAKRPAETTPSTGSKMMKMSQVVEEDGPKPQQQPSNRKLSTNAPVQVAFYKYSDCAGDLWESYKTDDDQPLYQVQIRHEAPRSLCYQFQAKFADFCKNTEGVPDTLAELQEHGIRLIIGDKNDPEGCRFVQWRPCFYIVGHKDSLYNFCLLLDKFWIWLADAMAKEQGVA